MKEEILVIDTASPRGSVGLFRGESPVSSRPFPDARSQSERLFPSVTEVLREAAVALPDLGALAVAVGPGAFTALRVGIAAAKAMSEVAGIPLIGMRNTQAAAWLGSEELSEGNDGLVILPASRGEFYFSPFRVEETRERVKMPERIDIATLQDWDPFLAQEGRESSDLRFSALISPSDEILRLAAEAPWGRNAIRIQVPDALLPALGAVAWQRHLAKEYDDPFIVDAAYVRRADADRGWVDARLHQ